MMATGSSGGIKLIVSSKGLPHNWAEMMSLFHKLVLCSLFSVCTSALLVRNNVSYYEGVGELEK